MFWFNDHKVDSFMKLLEVMGTLKKDDKDSADRLFKSCVTEWGDVDAKLFVGYLLGYFKHQRRIELGELLGVVHPIFGTNDPSTEMAVRCGLAQVRVYKPEILDTIKFKEEEPEPVTKKGAIEQRKVRADWNF